MSVVLQLGERCPARTELSDVQMSWLSRRPFAPQPAVRYHDCRLEYRHAGPHGDVCRQSEAVEWWIRWTLNSSEIAEVRACPTAQAESGEPDDDLICVLFEGHPGRHSYDLDLDLDLRPS